MRTFSDIQPLEHLNLEELAQINGGADPPPAVCKTIRRIKFKPTAPAQNAKYIKNADRHLINATLTF